MALTFRKSTVEDIEILLPIQKASFQEDLEKYRTLKQIQLAKQVKN